MNKILLITLLISSMFFIYILKTYYTINYKTSTYQLGANHNGYKKGSIGIEKYTNMNSKSAKLTYKVSNNDGIQLNNCPHDFWRHKPTDERLLINKIYSPQGTPLPVIPNFSKYTQNGTYVDGTRNTPQSMFTLAYNKCKPECCPSTYSCDNGCICTTKKQRDFISKRGNNKTIPDNNEY